MSLLPGEKEIGTIRYEACRSGIGSWWPNWGKPGANARRGTPHGSSVRRAGTGTNNDPEAFPASGFPDPVALLSPGPATGDELRSAKRLPRATSRLPADRAKPQRGPIRQGREPDALTGRIGGTRAILGRGHSAVPAATNKAKGCRGADPVKLFGPAPTLEPDLNHCGAEETWLSIASARHTRRKGKTSAVRGAPIDFRGH